MSSALRKITTRAKQLRKKHPNSKWISLVKKAGAEYRAGKLGKAGNSDSSRGAGHTSTKTRANTTGNRTSTGTKTITAHVKVGKAKKNPNRQTGTSSRRYDEMRTARAPGKRKSRSGVKYIERRKNRSDIPGKLTGVSARSLKSELKNRLKASLGKQLVRREMATTKRVKKKIQKQVLATKLQLRKLN